MSKPVIRGGSSVVAKRMQGAPSTSSLDLKFMLLRYPLLQRCAQQSMCDAGGRPRTRALEAFRLAPCPGP